MAAEIVPGLAPAPSPETFAAHAITTLSHPPESIDPESQAKACCQRARACMRSAQYAREDGGKAQALTWLKAARMLRITASVWRQRTRNADKAIVYFPCERHRGIPWTAKVPYARPAESVCPLCPPEAS
jgi:hypothetical protein